MRPGVEDDPAGGAEFALEQATLAAAEDIQIFTISVGTNYDAELMDEIATIGNGRHMHAEGTIEQIPAPKPRAKRSTIEVTALLLLEGTRVLLSQQPQGGLFERLWCLPLLQGHGEEGALAEDALERYGLHVTAWRGQALFKHVLTHRDIVVRIVHLEADGLVEALEDAFA